MAVASWKIIATDLLFAPQGEVQNVRDLQLSVALSRTDTLSFSVRADNPMTDLMATLSCFIKVYRNDTLVFFGMPVSSEENIDGPDGRLTVSCAGPSWLLGFRFPNKTALPVLYNSGTSTDRAAVAGGLIAGMYSQYAVEQIPDPTSRALVLADFPNPAAVALWRQLGYIPIDTTTRSMTSGSSVVYGIPPYKTMSEILTELSDSINGFEWRVIPQENWASGALTSIYMGQMTAAPVIGSSTPEARFEFGDGRLNVKSYKRTFTRDTQANYVSHLLTTPETSPPHAYDDTSMGNWHAMESLAEADLTDTTLRQALVDEHVNVRSEPRMLIEFNPMPDYEGTLPALGVDFDLGDTIPARAVLNGVERFSGDLRVWAAQYTRDESAVETLALVLSDQGT